MRQDEIKLQPHNMVDGIAVLLTESEIAELNRPPSEEDLINQLAQAKTLKIAELKNNLINAKEGKTPKEGSLESYQVDGVFRTFKVKLSDLATIGARVSRLEKAAVGTTAQWTDIDGNRLDLNLQQFESLRNHLDVRDQTLHMLYEEIKSEIKACTTLEQLEQIDINF